MKKYIIFILLSVLVLSSCEKANDNNKDYRESESFFVAENKTEEQDSTELESSEPADVDLNITETDMFTERDKRITYDKSKSSCVYFKGTGIETDSDTVDISESTVTLKNTGTYILEGDLTNGSVIVDAAKTDKIQIVLNGVNICSDSSAAIYVKSGDKVFITLAEGSNNTLSNGGSFISDSENNIDAVIFSKEDITFNGNGSLTINSPAGHGIVSKDDTVFTGGVYTINSASHGINTNDSIRICDATLKINSGKDGIHSENAEDASLGYVYISSGNINIESEGDGISAGAYIRIVNVKVNIVSGGGSENGTKESSDFWGGFMGGRPGQSPDHFTSTDNSDSSTSIKGIKATGAVHISGGSFDIDSADDAIHSNLSITVIDGSFNIATGDDAFHADETLEISGGMINITESYEGLEALNISVSGGNIKLIARDDGINAAGGTDQSGFGGGRGGDTFGHGGGRGPGGNGGMGGMNGGSSNGSINIYGGKLYIESSGDGIDANGTLEISGGYTVVCGPTTGDTATLDYDRSATISGGTFIGTGASGMAQTFSDAKQGLISLNVGSRNAGTEIKLYDSEGKLLASQTPELPFAVVIISTPELKSGETYRISVGSDSAEFEAN
ncbi:MAG: carbohydrate-binding domain-containing protein [Ruminococcaceae bacterium]|nr:carbohydrate-binding domain-containing protein [Oscillospiraceae bacterium]